jgi:hypothetical protein
MVIELMEKNLLQFGDKLEETIKASDKTLGKLLNESHAKLVTGVDHITEFAESELCDVAFITKSPSVREYIDECEYVDIKTDVMEQVNLLMAHVVSTPDENMDKTKTFLKQYKVTCEKTHCHLERQITEKFKEIYTITRDDGIEAGFSRYVMVTCCPMHRYEVENMSLVTVEVMIKLKIAKDDKKYDMYIYILSNGL